MSNTTELPAGLVGRFWLADRDENKLPGRLTLAEGVSPRLELDQPLTPPLRELDRQEQPNGTVTRRFAPAEDGPGHESLVLHGVFEDGTRVTLLDTFTVARKSLLFGPEQGQDRQWLQARSVLLGGHVGGPDELYTRIRLRLRHLDAWATLPGFSREVDPAQGRATLELRRCHPGPVSLEGGGQLELEQAARIDFSPVLGGGIRRVVWLRIVDLPLDLPRPPTADELDRRFVTPLASLVTLATGTDCPPVAVELATGPDEPWLTVHHSGLRSATDEVLSLHDQLVPLGVLELGRVATWLDRAEQLAPLPPVVAAAAVGAGRTLESELLELTTAAEGLHQRVFPDHQRFSPEQATAAREAATDAVAHLGENVRKATASALGHLEDPTYRQRVKELADHVEGAVPGVTGHTNRWISCVVDIRNEFAHRSSSGFLEAPRVPELFAVRQSLGWLLAGLLLLQTGLPPQVLAARIEAHQRYTLFLQQAREWLPRVFPPPTDQ